MSDKFYSHEAMMREIAARAELRLAEHQFSVPNTDIPFWSTEEFDAFVARRRQIRQCGRRAH